jgi:hypothetical protein
MPRKTSLKWEEPPEGRREFWQRIAKELKANPGEWAQIWEGGPSSTVSAINQGAVTVVRRDRGFETKTTNNTSAAAGIPRTCTLYMRYVEENDTTRKDS